MRYDYKTEMVCAQLISFDIDDNVVSNISFYGGCNGNLKAISKLVDGWTVEKIEEYLKGNLCGRRPTSCADQLAIAVREALEAQNGARFDNLTPAEA
ncbi:MAG: TIGR03905 family TSCPD domain-containing protein [Lachnospiraceae bacterium]|nr:TIGR03905 family TSCPD domain-containing protein [Lachnospiraceae bacterium]